MKHTTNLVVDAEPLVVSEVLADLATYPDWNDLVKAAELAPAGAADPGPAWWTTLQARVGPFARSKQLRMVRVHPSPNENPLRIRFERAEIDGRTHADWVMEAALDESPIGTEIELTLSYDGGLWTSSLDGVLAAAIRRASDRLPTYLASL